MVDEQLAIDYWQHPKLLKALITYYDYNILRYVYKKTEITKLVVIDIVIAVAVILPILSIYYASSKYKFHTFLIVLPSLTY